MNVPYGRGLADPDPTMEKNAAPDPGLKIVYKTMILIVLSSFHKTKIVEKGTFEVKIF